MMAATTAVMKAEHSDMLTVMMKVLPRVAWLVEMLGESWVVMKVDYLVSL
jgi:hypothetical protein